MAPVLIMAQKRKVAHLVYGRLKKQQNSTENVLKRLQHLINHKVRPQWTTYWLRFHKCSLLLLAGRDGISDNQYIGKADISFFFCKYRISVSVKVLSVKISDIGKRKISYIGK